MTIPANSAASLENNQDDIADKEDTNLEMDEVKQFEATVTEVVKNITRGVDGKYVLPEDLPPAVKFAAIAEQRRRDTQSEFTKTNQRLKALDAENKALKTKAIADVPLNLSPEQAEELEDLKFSDPEAWRKKVNRLEVEARAAREKDLDDEIGKVSAETLAKEETERRKDVLAEFNKSHPEFVIDDSVIQNDIPPRITKKLETGEISFETFLEECCEYSKTGKVVAQENLNDMPNLSKVGGGSQPDKHAKQEDIILSYNKEVF